MAGVRWEFGLGLDNAFFLLLVAVVLTLRLTRLGDDHIVIGEHELLATSRGKTHRWPWAEVLEVLEVGVSGTGTFAGVFSPGGVVHVRPDGGVWDVPGPNMPLPLLVPVFGRPAHRRLREALRAACAEHDVPFEVRGYRMDSQPRPGSPLRSSTRRGARARKAPRAGS